MAGMLPGLLSGLGSIPAGLGGLGGGPLDALGALPALASQMGDSSVNGHHDKAAEPDDDEHGGKGGSEEKPEKPGEKAGQQGESGLPGAGSAATAQQPTPVAAAPAAAPTTDAGRVVQMPDGTPVTAGSSQKANAIKALMNGSSVTDAYKSAGIAIPPAGTPVTAPVDPSQLTPGVVAQYKSREAVPFLGNGKIWLDGQPQPQSTLPAGDFMGWIDPQAAGATASAAAPATVPSAPVTQQ